MSFEIATCNFEKAVINLRNNLHYLADNDKVSNSFIRIQNLLLEHIINYQRAVEFYISDLEMDNEVLSRRIHTEYKKLLASKESLEAICFIHGIMDIQTWLNKGRSSLVYQAVEFINANTVQIPYVLKNRIDELSNEEKNLIFSLLNKKYNERMESEIKELLNSLRKANNA